MADYLQTSPYPDSDLVDLVSIEGGLEEMRHPTSMDGYPLKNDLFHFFIIVNIPNVTVLLARAVLVRNAVDLNN